MRWGSITQYVFGTFAGAVMVDSIQHGKWFLLIALSFGFGAISYCIDCLPWKREA